MAIITATASDTPHDEDNVDSGSAALVALRRIVALCGTSDEVQMAVDVARDLDVSWQSIGDALGMRRGAAYQRFRNRPNGLPGEAKPPSKMRT